MFSYHGASGPESSTLCFEEVHRGPVGSQTTTEFGQVHQNAAPGRTPLSTVDLLLL